jgi:LacI family transcriptional regulator
MILRESTAVVPEVLPLAYRKEAAGSAAAVNSVALGQGKTEKA